ncbi:hypothetical protein ENU1_032290 [Entamoeba nuttalli P19]|uniref:Uncharacterized protein n=2 Tax=Entamoeba nuttalli TaxID=412467 RepID=K2H3Q9_ENTNP|nr:hypothetical protein ENU1_032290 [Entamoeba nuttalli P19]EKE42108.1 hypothetical protein ENU1_032290 [Entamoeba nuttalli P19]|eukprot:XP_008855557.1 hypothetical protein ENU1_032290 [Entamoeba nuttalli P19]
MDKFNDCKNSVMNPLFDNEQVDFKEYGKISRQALFSIFLDFIQKQTNCEIAFISMNDYHGDKFKTDLIHAAKKLGIICYLIPCYAGSIVSYISSHYDNSVCTRAILDVGYYHTSIVIFNSYLNTAEVLLKRCTNIGGYHFTQKVREYIIFKANEQGVSENQISSSCLKEKVSSLRSSFSERKLASMDIILDCKGNDDIRITAIKDEFATFTQKECEELSQFIKDSISRLQNHPQSQYFNPSQIKDCSLSSIEVVGKGWLLCCVKDAISSISNISTSLDPSFSSAYGAGVLANQLIEPSRRIQLIDNSSNTTIGGNHLSKSDNEFVLRMDTGDTAISSSYYNPNGSVEQRYIIKSEENKSFTPQKCQNEKLNHVLQQYDVTNDRNKLHHLKRLEVEREDTIKPDKEKGLSFKSFKEYYEKNSDLVYDLCKRKTKLLIALAKKKKSMELSRIKEIQSNILSIRLEDQDKLNEIENELK